MNQDGVSTISEIYERTRKLSFIRKNLNTYGTLDEKMCQLDHSGVDLNRNYGEKFAYDD